MLSPAAKRLVEKYGIHYDKAPVVPHDDDLADRVIHAGLEFAVEIGAEVVELNSMEIVFRWQEGFIRR